MKHILLIVDNDEIRKNAIEILTLAGYKISIAVNGKVGVQKALINKPDLIVCEVMMPVLDGYGVLLLLNKNPELIGIPFIFISNKAERSDFRKGMELGADDYFTIPFSSNELLKAISGRLNKVAMYKKSVVSLLKNQSDIPEDISGEEAIGNLITGRNVNHYKKKQIIYSESNHPLRLFYVEKGKVKTYKTNPEGKEFIVNIYGIGDFVGHIALLGSTVYHETAEAIDDTELSIIPAADFTELLNNHPGVAQLFIKKLAQSVNEKDEQLLGLAYNSLRKRVADALMMLNEKFGKEGAEKFSIHISREDLANIAGTATESLIRTLSDFKAEKLIAIKEGNIIILNEKKLLKMLN